MQFKKKSLLYKINDKWNFCDLDWFWLPYLPSNTNICQVIRCTVFSLLIGWPIIFTVSVALSIIVLVFVFGIVVPIVFLIGQKLDFSNFSNYCVYDEFKPIERLPKIAGKKIYPIYPVLLIGGWLLIWQHSNLIAPTLKWGGISLALVICGIIIVFTVSRSLRSDTYKALKCYLVAKKEKWCPTVEFVD